MSDEVRVIDPATVERMESVGGCVERTAFRIDDRLLSVLRVDEASAWHRRDGAIYAWVRAGAGRVLTHATDEGRALSAGDFLRVPTGTVHRFVAGDGGLEVLAAVDGVGVAPADPPTAVDEGARPRVVGPDDLVPTVESPDLLRETPFPGEDVLPMRVRAAGGAAAGWHHHADNVYFGYAVDGPSETEYGPAGDRVARIEVGECFHVPPGLVHRDTNPTDEAHTGIVWLCGGEPWVVNVDGPA
jgi:quercetin dioxygenase-like cupin family protein